MFFESARHTMQQPIQTRWKLQEGTLRVNTVPGEPSSWLKAVIQSFKTMRDEPEILCDLSRMANEF